MFDNIQQINGYEALSFLFSSPRRIIIVAWKFRKYYNKW